MWENVEGDIETAGGKAELLVGSQKKTHNWWGLAYIGRKSSEWYEWLTHFIQIQLQFRGRKARKIYVSHSPKRANQRVDSPHPKSNLGDDSHHAPRSSDSYFCPLSPSLGEEELSKNTDTDYSSSDENWLTNIISELLIIQAIEKKFSSPYECELAISFIIEQTEPCQIDDAIQKANQFIDSVKATKKEPFYENEYNKLIDELNEKDTKLVEKKLNEFLQLIEATKTKIGRKSLLIIRQDSRSYADEQVELSPRRSSHQKLEDLKSELKEKLYDYMQKFLPVIWKDAILNEIKKNFRVYSDEFTAHLLAEWNNIDRGSSSQIKMAFPSGPFLSESPKLLTKKRRDIFLR